MIGHAIRNYARGVTQTYGTFVQGRPVNPVVTNAKTGHQAQPGKLSHSVGVNAHQARGDCCPSPGGLSQQPSPLSLIAHTSQIMHAVQGAQLEHHPISQAANHH